MLRSYTGVQEQVTYLTSACTDSDLTLSVDDSQAVSIGISELEDELIFVKVSQDGTLTVPPFGRGFNGTTAATHALNTMLVHDPVFPTVNIKQALNQAVQSTYPALYAVKTTTFTFAGSQAVYELPADCDKVLKVTYEATGASGYWPTISRWEFDQNADETTGKALVLHDAPEQGRTVKVVYQGTFTALSDPADTLAGIGFPESAADVLLYGATAQLLRFVDIARLQTGSVENVSRSDLVSPGAANNTANMLYAMYQQRLQEERRKLLDAHQPQMHFTR